MEARIGEIVLFLASLGALKGYTRLKFPKKKKKLLNMGLTTIELIIFVRVVIKYFSSAYLKELVLFNDGIYTDTWLLLPFKD